MTKIVRGGYVMAVVLALVLLASIACAKAEEKPAVAPAPTAKAAPAPTATTVPAPAVVRPTHWTWGLVEDPTINFDPLQPGGSLAAGRARSLVMDPLFQQEGTDPKAMTDVPLLAESWRFITPTHVRYSLRKNIKFQDGAAFTAQDVEYRWKELINNPKLSGSAAFAAEVAGIEVIDNYTIDMKLKRELGPIMTILRGAAGTIPSKAYREKVGAEEFRVKPIGTGPYKLASIEGGQKSIFEANSDYWRGPVFPPKLTLFWIRDETTRAAALTAGTVDGAEDIPHEEVPRLSSNPGIEPILFGRFKNRWHTNYGDPPFNNESLRKAVNYAIDREAIVKGLLQGRGSIDASTLVAGQAGYNADLKPYPYDPTLAKKLIKDAGMDGTSFQFFSVTGRFPKDREIAQLTVSQWQAVGLNPQLKFITREEVFNSRDNRTFTISMCCIWTANPEPDGELPWDYLSIGASAGRPLSGDTPLAIELNKMWLEQRGIVDVAKREEALRKIDRFVYDHYLTVITHSYDRYIAVSRKIDYYGYPDGSVYNSCYYDCWSARGLKPVKIKW